MRHDCDNYIDKIRNQSGNVFSKKLVRSMHNHKHISIKDSRTEY